MDAPHSFLQAASMISVVIPAFNEEENIGLCLEGLARQNTAERMEVIVVDNASTDRTAAVAETYRATLPDLRVVHEPQKGRGAARTTGFACAQGDPIFSLDADTVVPPDWVEAYLKLFRDGDDVVAVTGLPRISDCSTIDNALFNVLMPLQMKAYRVLFGHYWLSGFSFAIRRDAYRKAGGFNPVTDFCEDLDLSFRVFKTKTGKIRLEQMHPVQFSGRRFKKGLVRGYMQYAAAFSVKFMLRRERVILQVVDNNGMPVGNDGAFMPIFREILLRGLQNVRRTTSATVRKASSLPRTAGNRIYLAVGTSSRLPLGLIVQASKQLHAVRSGAGHLSVRSWTRCRRGSLRMRALVMRGGTGLLRSAEKGARIVQGK